jgi:hypothetical protein
VKPQFRGPWNVALADFHKASFGVRGFGGAGFHVGE